MPRAKTSLEPTSSKRKAITPEVREQQMISLAVNLAESQLRDGTASSQTINHYLKLGSSKERLEQEILEKNKELIDAKVEALKASKSMVELYDEAIKAMRKYTGHQTEEDYED